MPHNILRSMERMEDRAQVSQLFPDERPSPTAVSIVSSHDWRGACEYRLSEALYKNRPLWNILFPYASSDASAYEDQLNPDAFSHEESVRVDHRIQRYQFAHPDMTFENAASILKKQGVLNPPTREQIEQEEKIRPNLVHLFNTFQKQDYAGLGKEADAVQKEGLDRVQIEYMRDVFEQAIGRRLNDHLQKKEHVQALDLLDAASHIAFIPPERFASSVRFIPAALIAARFLDSILSEDYDRRWAQWTGYGIEGHILTNIIRDNTQTYVEDVWNKKPGMIFDDFSALMDKMKERGLLDEDEHEESLRESLIKSTSEHVVGVKEEELGGLYWVDAYKKNRADAVKRGLCTEKEFNERPEIQKAAEDFLLRRFVGGVGIPPLRRAMDDVVRTGIMTREYVNWLPSILEVAATCLASSSDLKTYRDRLRRYREDIGIGTVDFFRKHEKVKAALARLEKNDQERNTSE